ncbi:hypothetical protein [Bacteroides propionicifaciens]|uniref:hypothetical protein n=1 Tax=Bacteroides propionicifaciens TaxID=392838 RepID=UPI000361CBA0|nr:hypothetical protein [Bacteroides propionicifaciens]
MDLFLYSCIGIGVGMLFSWIFYEKGYVMLIAVLVSLFGAWAGGGICAFFFDSLLGCLLSSFVGALFLLTFGVIILLEYARKKRN